MQEDLKKLGLTGNEIKVYISLLHLGETQVGGIINDLKIHRQIAYNALDALAEKNLVIKNMKNKVYHYKINDPKILVENIQQQELIAQRLSKNILAEMKKSRRDHEVTIYDGQEKIRKSFMLSVEEIPRDTTIYVLSNYVNKFEEVLGSDFLVNKYHKLRRQKNTMGKNIADESFREEYVIFNKTTTDIRELRYLPNGTIPPLSVSIWPNHLLFSYFGKDMFNIVVKNQDFRDAYFRYFQKLWKIAKK